MFNLRSLRFCLLALLMAIVCVVAAPSAATVSIANTALQQSQNSAERLEQQGRSHYEAGQFAEAAASFQQAAQAYAAQGNELKQAIALSNLALAAQQLGQWAEANQAITQSLNLLEAGDSDAHRLALAEALDIQSALFLAQGNADAAFDTGERAANLYEQLGDRNRATESRISQAQALQILGLYRRAIATLVTALGWQPATLTSLETLNTHLQMPPSLTTIAALQSLGEALRVTGNLEAARAVLQPSLVMAQQLQQTEAIAAAQFRLANLTWTEALVNLSRDNLTLAEAIELVQQAQQGNRQVGINSAEEFYRTSASALVLYAQAATATTATAQLQAQLNQLRIAVETNRQAEVQALLPQVQSAIDRLPSGHTAIEARINLAQTLINASPLQPQAIAQSLAIAIQQARELQDPRAESNALGLLGSLYEQTGQFSEAQQVTQQALLLAQNGGASELTYRWQWQLGRLLKATAEAKDPNSPTYTEAIAAYTAAVDTLKSIRADLIATAPDEQLSFQTTIEPIYRQLVSLLLQSQQDGSDDQNLRTSRDLIESLQLAELDNFFREACLNGNPTMIDQVDQTAAIIYPIILPDRLAVIVSLPQSSSQSDLSQNLSQRSFIAYTTVVSQDQVEATVNLLRDSLDQANDYRFLLPAQQLYDWLIRPAQVQLAANQVNTLVFVLDGVLRNIPMSVLHDGQQYLVEQPYSIALTPGLQLLESQPLSPDQLQAALLAGVSEARQGYSALPNVRNELAQIQAELPRTTTLLDRGLPPVDQELQVNGGFTNTNFETAIESTPYPIVHLATHGQFSSQLTDTYILTGDGRLTIDDLRIALQTTAVRRDRTLELLVLSACSTATGDNRAALGLAGVAVRAGARSTVATLWQVNDYSSAEFMGTFYRELSTVRTLHISKAAALQQAQRSLLQYPEYQHPYFWAPYVLIGNWQ